MVQHPLDPLSVNEVRQASRVLLKGLDLQRDKIRFKVIDLAEPSKDEALVHLLESGPVPDRRARIYYQQKQKYVMSRAIINITSGILEKTDDLPDAQGPVDWVEYDLVTTACNAHPGVLAEVAKLKVPEAARVLNDPWAYGTDDAKERRRLFQCYMYLALDDDEEANHYSIPLPLAPIFDAHTLELVDLQKLPLGVDDEIDDETQPWVPIKPVEYSANILGSDAFRKDLKPLQVTQPEGSSFNVDHRTVSWQKWNFQLGWSLREGPVLHDVRYEDRPLFYRVSMSEMTVPYGDPRTPYHRKQAFDLGDSGFGLTSNSLALGCDCLGHIAYFDGVRVSATGDPVVMPNVVCMHEIDDGIGWKHTHFRSMKSSVVRDRKLVIQCTSTVANYEYILAFVLDQAANIHIEVRATGILSTMPIRPDLKTSPWGTVVAPGVLAVNHQHLFCVRIDPILDGERKNTILYEDCIPVRDDPELDPYGCAFRLDTTPITSPGGYDLDLTKARTYKIVNPARKNDVSGKLAGYKLHASPSQMLMMGPETFNHRRGVFASKPIWVTHYRDNELWAAGEFTNQSREDTGLAEYAARAENVEGEDVVLWHSFGLTHVTRPEDFPVMPVEKLSCTLKPTSFFNLNPSNDVPRSNQRDNQSTLHNQSLTVPGCCQD
ncbi:copper amine oxidase [Colletotrichum phormii]|uniref:Amine oxidase n=1 Tax=Colletotrichum phormii TaxID=359342 RepID=A0AAI9ZBI8_9PEZI|nr:copper amine oxidase [Colletotrichum phormii]KAK1613491.1 copper amine oxidase [Colletotrichum phormii]